MALTCIKWCRAALGVAAFALGTIAPAAPVAAPAATDADVLAAREAGQKGQWRVLEGLRPKFAGHVLEPYPTYWLLSGTLDRANPAEVRAFLDSDPRSPLAESLRRDWLKMLGASADWERFREELPRFLGEDAEIACFALQERAARGDGDVPAEARALFVAGREAPLACEPVFAAAATAGRISESDIWARVRKTLAAGAVRDAKRASAMLPAPERLNEKALDRANADPARYLAHERATRFAPAARELVVFAIERLARTKADEAAERLPMFAARLGAEATAYAWGQVAWQGAMSHDPRALEWYARAADAPLTANQVAWKARAALRAGDWKTVLTSVQGLPPEEARDAGWRYWRARALRAQGETTAAEGLLRGVATERSFYGLLAADEMGIAVAPDWTAFQPAAEDFTRVHASAGIERALALYRVGLDTEAFREWTAAIRAFDDRTLLAAAEVARQANVSDRAINTADRTLQVHDYSLRYPTPHREALAASARQWDLDEALVYSLIRQESRFRAEARSPVGATGLMQLMPATARWVAKQIPVPTFKPQMLTSPEVNIQMGSYYFRRVLTDLGHPMLATAAYNAGPGRARRWRDDRPLEGAIYAETIPFNETRDYVKKVFANAWFYRSRLTGRTVSFRELLGTVPGKRDESPSAALAASALP
jgi:soluble lytic murein transglycosylase